MDLTKLKELEANQNSGMVVTCVRDIIKALEKGDIDMAKVIYSNEYDKVRNYPAILEELITLKIVRVHRSVLGFDMYIAYE